MKTKKMKTLGQKMMKVKTWKNASSKIAKVSDIGGKGLMLMGSATGQPEIVAAGSGLIGISKGANEISSLLKQNNKKHHK